jgi:hypothetical protein
MQRTAQDPADDRRRAYRFYELYLGALPMHGEKGVGLVARLPNAADLMTLEEAAADAGYSSASTLRKAAREGRLRVVRHGARTVLTTAEWVSAYEDRIYGKGGRPRGAAAPAKAAHQSTRSPAGTLTADHA